MPHLGPKLRAFALDLRGHGDSEWSPERAYRVADYATDVAGLIESLGLERPALVGHSLGAFVALRFAVDHPRVLGALALIDGRASFSPGGSRYMRLLGMLNATRYRSLEEAVSKFRPLPVETIATPQVLAHVARHGFRNEGGCWVNKFDRASLGGHQPFDLEGRLHDVECPVLVVRGEHSKVLSSATAARLANACRNGRMVTIPGCQHHVLIDRPDLLGAELRAFLEP